jgi:hypothetical protein
MVEDPGKIPNVQTRDTPKFSGRRSEKKPEQARSAFTPDEDDNEYENTPIEEQQNATTHSVLTGASLEGDEKDIQEEASTHNVTSTVSSPKKVDTPIPTNNARTAPHPPPVTYQRTLSLSQATTNAVQPTTNALEAGSSPTLSVPLKTTFEALCRTIKTKIGEDATSEKCVFTENTSNASEVTLTPPKGDEVKIKHNGDNAICTFTGSEGMEQATNVLLVSFIASGQTELTIGGSDREMVLTLAKSVANKLKTNSELKVNLDPAARTILSSSKEGSKLITDLDKTKLDASKPPSTARRLS